MLIRVGEIEKNELFRILQYNLIGKVILPWDFLIIY